MLKQSSAKLNLMSSDVNYFWHEYCATMFPKSICMKTTVNIFFRIFQITKLATIDFPGTLMSCFYLPLFLFQLVAVVVMLHSFVAVYFLFIYFIFIWILYRFDLRCSQETALISCKKQAWRRLGKLKYQATFRA